MNQSVYYLLVLSLFLCAGASGKSAGLAWTTKQNAVPDSYCPHYLYYE